MVLFLDYLQKKKIVQGEVTRKMGHFILGCILIVQPSVFTNMTFPTILCLTISTIIYLSSKKNKLACADNVERKSHGTYLYPIGVLLTLLTAYALENIYLFYPSIIILMISDIASAFIGSYCMKIKYKYGYKINRKVLNVFNKTIYGSIAFFISTFIILVIYYKLNIIPVILVSLLTTAAEFFSTKGYDNFTIPITALLGLYLLL